MSTIRKYGVAFHLIPTVGDELWVETVRESDGAVISCGPFLGESEDDFAEGVDEWFEGVVGERLESIEVLRCRACGQRRRDVRQLDDGALTTETVVEYEFDLCSGCAAGLELSAPWLMGYLAERYPETERSSSSEEDEDEDDDECEW